MPVGGASSAQAAPAPHGGPPIGRVPTVSSVNDIRLPLDAYGLSPVQLQQIDDAQNVAVHVCLRRLGFDLSMHVFSSAFAGGSRYYLWFLTAADAAQHGYRAAAAAAGPGQAAAGPGASSGGGQQSASPQAIGAWQGSLRRVNGKPVPPGGCERWGERAVRNPSETFDDVVSLAQRTEVEVLSDSRMLRVFSAWRSCMARRGFHYQTPMDAENGRPAGWPAKLGPAEIATAGADAACRQAVNVMGMWTALMTAYEQRLVNRMQPQLIAAKRVTDQWLRNAASFGD